MSYHIDALDSLNGYLKPKKKKKYKKKSSQENENLKPI